MKVVETVKLENGALVTVYDESRTIAGDRWLVSLRIVTVLPWMDWMDEVLAAEGGEAGAMKNESGEFCFEVTRERNFVAEDEKGPMIENMVAMIHDNIIAYLAQPGFGEKLFRKRLEELGEKRRLLRNREDNEKAVLDDDDDGPADFSACFR